ncbi:unnamed protein product [Boreogadus saida]
MPSLARIRETVAARQQKTRERVDKKCRARPPSLQVSDWVRARRPQRHNKLASFWSQPRQISRLLGPATFLLDDGSRWHASRLRKVPAPLSEHLATARASHHSPATWPLILAHPRPWLHPPQHHARRLWCRTRGRLCHFGQFEVFQDKCGQEGHFARFCASSSGGAGVPPASAADATAGAVPPAAAADAVAPASAAVGVAPASAAASAVVSPGAAAAAAAVSRAAAAASGEVPPSRAAGTVLPVPAAVAVLPVASVPLAALESAVSTISAVPLAAAMALAYAGPPVVATFVPPVAVVDGFVGPLVAPTADVVVMQKGCVVGDEVAQELQGRKQARETCGSKAKKTAAREEQTESSGEETESSEEEEMEDCVTDSQPLTSLAERKWTASIA